MEIKGRIINWGIKEVAQLDGQPAMVIVFETAQGNRSFESLFFKRDGEVNKKTIETIYLCGFSGDDFTSLSECDHSSLNTSKEFNLTLKDVNGFQVVEWVNDPSKPKSNSKFGLSDKKKLGGMKLAKAAQEAREKIIGSKPQEAPGFDQDEQIEW